MKHCLLILLLMSLGACGNLGNRDGAPSGVMLKPKSEVLLIPDAIPKVEARSRYGNPESYVVFGKRYTVLKSASGYRKRGIASWYGTKFHGKRTSSGEAYDMYAMTAAHKSLPLPTYVRVSNLKNKRSVIVKVNDRGPFHENRIIDLSYAAAIKLGISDSGTGVVEMSVIDPRKPDKKKVALTEKKSAKIVNNNPGVNLFVQVGAFSDKRNARGIQSRLLDSDINNVMISRASRSPASVYRVRVGPIKTIEKADRIADRINKLGLGSSAIVVE